MAHADPAGARKRTTRKTKSTRDEDAFLYDLSLPTVPLSSALDPKLPPDPVESHKSGKTFGCCSSSYSSATAHRRSSFARLLDPTDLFGSGRARKVSSGIRASPLKKRTAFTSNSTKRSGINRSYFHHQEKAHCRLAARFYTRYVHQP